MAKTRKSTILSINDPFNQVQKNILEFSSFILQGKVIIGACSRDIFLSFSLVEIDGGDNDLV